MNFEPSAKVDPVCMDMSFEFSLPLSNGVVCYNGATAGARATYVCDPEYTLCSSSNLNGRCNPVAVRMCQTSGSWSGFAGFCEGMSTIIIVPAMESETILINNMFISDELFPSYSLVFGIFILTIAYTYNVVLVSVYCY